MAGIEQSDPITVSNIKKRTSLDQDILKQRCMFDLYEFLKYNNTNRMSFYYGTTTDNRNQNLTSLPLLFDFLNNAGNFRKQYMFINSALKPEIDTKNKNGYSKDTDQSVFLDFCKAIDRLIVSILGQNMYGNYKELFNYLVTTSEYMTKSEEVKEGLESQEVVELKKPVENQLNPHFDYPHLLPYMKSPDYQNAMWIVRTWLFYTLLIEVSKKPTDFDVSYYRLSIFGSLNATSDIDVGFTYTNPQLVMNNKGALSSVIKMFEKSFLDNMGVNSLMMDIEPYANLMTIPKQGQDLYYLDTRELTHDQFLSLAPYVGAGIIRNYIQSEMDLHPSLDIRRQSSENTDAVRQINEKINAFVTMMNGNTTNPAIKLMKDFFNIMFTSEYSETAFHSFFDKGTDTGTNISKEYLTHNYGQGVTAYYQYVKEAEDAFQSKIITDNDIKQDDIVDLLKKTAHADVFRAESYVFSNTVMDVVRGDQGGEYAKMKDSATTCGIDGKHTAPLAPCLIGPYGFIMSLLENIGYIIRFQLTYCEDAKHINTVKCKDKNKKYLNRILHTFQHLHDSTRLGDSLHVDNIKQFTCKEDIPKYPLNSKDPISQYMNQLHALSVPKSSSGGGRKKRRTIRKRAVSRKRTFANKRIQSRKIHRRSKRARNLH